MCLRQFSSNRNVTIPNNTLEVGERTPDSVGSLEEDHRPSGSFQVLKPRFSVFRPNWGESKEKERSSVNSGRRECSQHGAGAGDRFDANPRLGGRPNEMQTWVGNRWRPSIRHQSEVLSLLQSLEQRDELRRFIVLVKARRWRVDRVSRKQARRAPRVFRGNQPHLAQYT